MIALLDSDVIAYRSAIACKDEDITMACRKADNVIVDVLLNCDLDDLYYDKWELYLTGSNNFRHGIAVTAPYKGNRAGEKPHHLAGVRKHLIEKWGAVVSEGQEADDAIGIRSTELLNQCVMVSVDKDFLQLEGHHYSFVKRVHHKITKHQGMLNFYQQLLTGDATDNIIGLHGIGPKTAAKMLAETTTEQQMYDICLEAYEGNADRVLENARLLFLRRKEGQLWMPPKTITTIPKRKRKKKAQP